MRTAGKRAVAWIEQNLVHGEGDYYGRAFRLEDWQRRLIYRLYEVDDDNRHKHRRVLVGLPKGNGKTELAAAVACYELAGGHVDSPLIPVAAASFEQANLVFGAARAMVSQGPLQPFVEVFDTSMRLRDRPGRMYRVAAAAGTNDGQRPTFFVADEIHEWTGSKERVHLVISNGLAKRRGGWALNITTAGFDLENSLLGRLYRYGLQVESGEVDDSGFLMWWQTAADSFDLDDPDQLAAAVEEANPASFLPHDRVIARFHEIPEFEFRRYHLNQWVATETQWLPTGAWSELADPDRTVDADTEIVLGFDGSYNQDSTALIGCTVDDGHVFTLGVWEKPEHDDQWIVPREEVLATIHEAFERFDVRRMEADPSGWHRELEELAERYGDDVVLALPPTRSRMIPACSRFYTAVVQGDLTHDGDPALARHMANATLKEGPNGAWIVKPHRGSARKIDAAVAGVVSFDARSRVEPAAEVHALFV